MPRKAFGCHAFEQKLREKTKGEVRLDHNQLSIVRRATRPCHWFWYAGASRQCGNLNLNKRMTARSLHRTNWLMSRQEIYDTRLTHSRLSGECQLKTKPMRSVAGSPATAARPKGRTGPAPPQARPLPSFVSFSSARLIELSILFKRELFAVFDHCILGVWRVCFYDFNTLGNAFEAAAFAAPRIKRYVEIPFIGFRAAAGVV